jgi:predicted Zn-dependent protease
LFHKSVAYVCQDDLEKASKFIRRSIDKHSNLSWVWIQQANVLGLMNKRKKARNAADKAARANRSMTPEHYVSRVKAMGGSPTTIQSRIIGLRNAGLIDTSS